MSRTSRVRGEHQKNIVRMMDGLTGRYNGWEIWQDFIYMSSSAIANAFPGPFRSLREKAYLERASRYSPEELSVFFSMFGEVVNAMEAEPNQDLLGDLFMSMELGDHWKGQFFTPYHLCRCMADIESGEGLKQKLRKLHWISVNDPACGAGALLIAFANSCLSKGINYQERILFVAQDMDFLAGMMCYIQLSLMGCAGYVVIGDTLSSPGLALDDRGLIPEDGPNVWYTPMYYSDIWQGRKMIKLEFMHEIRKETGIW